MTLDTFLLQLCQHCGVAEENCQIAITEQEDRVEVQLTVLEEDSGRFIGYHGEALQAIQRVARLAFEAQYPGKKIILNVNDYRERRMAQLREKVAQIADRVLQTGHSYTFNHFLPSHERFAIHTALAELPNGHLLESFSDGEGSDRRLTIALREESPEGDQVEESRTSGISETEERVTDGDETTETAADDDATATV